MQNFNKYCFDSKNFIDYKGSDVPLEFLLNKLDNCFKKENDNFAEICFLVKQIHDVFLSSELSRLYLRNDPEVSYNFDSIMLGFGISKSESSRLINCFDKYCCLDCSDLTKAKCSIIEEFKDFSKSKLFELLPVDNLTLVNDLKNQVIRFDMTCAVLRKYVKNYQAIQKTNSKSNNLETRVLEQLKEIEEETIPQAYNPKKHYDFSYFEKHTKAQLLNMIWELQKECEKLRNLRKN